jgi:hypothetical protein
VGALHVAVVVHPRSPSTCIDRLYAMLWFGWLLRVANAAFRAQEFFQ